MAEVAKGIIDIEINTGSAASQLKSLQAQINAFNMALNKGSKIQGAYAAEYAKELQLAINRTGAFTAEAVRLNTAAATLDKTLSKGRTSLGQFFSAKFNKDSAVAAEVMALAAERARRMQTQFIATSAAANGMQEALAIRPMAQFSSEMAITAQKSQILASMFRQGTTQLINFGKNVQWAGRQLMVGFTVPLTIFGNTAGRTFMELEKQLISFKKVYGDIFTTPAELNQNLEAVTNLAKEYTKYGVAVKDTIGLAAQAAAAGRKNADLTDAVAQATRLATLGQMDQNAALETTISLQSAFRLSGQELADTINFLNMVENQTVVSLQDLAAAIPRVAPVIQGLGGDVKDLSVFLAAMQEGGVDAAEGANALKSGLASLINPTKQATQMLSGMGINLQAIIDANKGDLMATVMAFSQALASLDQFSRQQALEQVFGKFQYAKLGALFDNISREGSQAQQVIATMGYTTEQLGATAEKELKTIEQSFGVQLTGAVERFKLAIAPVGEIFVKLAIPIVNFLTKIIEKFNGLSDGQKQFIAIATVITGIVIPAGTMLFGLLMNLTGTLLKMSQSFGAFAKGLVTGGPLGAIKALTQSSKYLSLSEIDAAMAAQQLSVASEAVNIALQEQAVSARMAETAIESLVQTYMSLISTQNAAAKMQGFAVPGAAANAAKNIRTGGSGFRLRRAFGGPIPGSGSQDTVPAMLTPGEFVINKEAAQRNFNLLNAINSGNIKGFNKGGRVSGVQYFNDGGEAKSFIDLVEKGVFKLEDVYSNPSISDDVKEEIKKYFSKDIQSKKAADYSKGDGRTTFAHMQKNILSNDNAKERNSFFDSVYDEYRKSYPKNPSQSQKNRMAELEIGKLSGWKNWKAVGNLGFDLSGATNTLLTQNTNPTLKTLDLMDELDNLFKSGNNPYERMLRNIGIAEANIVEVSNKVHQSVKDYLTRMDARGIKVVSDRILYGNSGPLRSGLIPRAVIRGLSSAGVSGSSIDQLFKIFESPKVKGESKKRKQMSPIRSGSVSLDTLDELIKSGDIQSYEDVVSTKGPSKGRVRTSAKLVTFKNGQKAIVGLLGTNTSLKTTIRSIIQSPKNLDIIKKSLSLVSRRRLGFNSGNIVPGSGNKDTVPAMLTPGEFVVNKEATSKNKNLLNAINSGNVEGYNLGGIISRIASSKAGQMATSPGAKTAFNTVAPMAAMMSGNPAIIAASFIPALIKPLKGLSTMIVGKVGPAVLGMTGAFAALGFAAYKLNKQVSEAQKAGAEMTKAMYGTAKTTEGIAEAFGRQTFAQQARIAAAERAGGQEISQEAQQASSGFIQSQAGQQMLKDIGTVKAGGGDPIEALRNQLSAAIIAGAINTEEARAIAVEIGTELKDENIGIQVSAELTKLLGPDGKDILKNLSTITAEISPKIDSNKLAQDVSKAYDKLNVGEKFVQMFRGGEVGFSESYKYQQAVESSAAVLQRELEARQLLLASYQDGTLALDEFNTKIRELEIGSTTSLDAIAQALGFENFNDLQTQGSGNFDLGTPQQMKAQRFLEEFREDYKTILENTPGMNKETIEDLMNTIDQLGPQAYSDLIRGEIGLGDIQIMIDLQNNTDMSYNEIVDTINKLEVLRKYPNIEKSIKIVNYDPEVIDAIYEDLAEFERLAEEGPLTKEIIVETTGIKELESQLTSEFMTLLNSLPTSVTIPLILEMEMKIKTGEGSFKEQTQAELAQSAADQAFRNLQKAFQQGPGGPNDGPGDGSGGTGTDYKKFLAERFAITDKMLSMEQQKYQDIISLRERENELDQRNIEQNQRALDQLSKQEDAINKSYENRVSALDNVTRANQRLQQQEQSRISLASALASGDIAGAASTMSEMAATEAANQIEDTRAALELQREEDLKNLKVEINGQLFTREEINARIDAIEENIYQRNLKIRDAQDAIYNLEQDRLKNSREREKIETKLFLLEQQKAIIELKRKKVGRGGLSAEEASWLQDYRTSYNQMVGFFNATYGENLQTAMYGGKIKKYAMGGMVFRKKDEAPPPLKMAFGSVVPGLGNTDRVPALLTPGEFVIRKSVAQANMPLLEKLNNGISGPSYTVPKSDFGVREASIQQNTGIVYNDTYSINVNVSGTNASPDDIANVVISKLSQFNSGNVRGIRY